LTSRRRRSISARHPSRNKVGRERLAKYSHPPKSVSRDFGQLAVNRHFSSGIDWAMAGAAIVDVVIPTPAALRNARRFMVILPVGPLALSFFDAGHRRKNSMFIDGRKRNA